MSVRDCVPMHGHASVLARDSMAQQTATTAVGLELGGDDGLDGTIGLEGTRSRCVGHRDDSFSSRAGARRAIAMATFCKSRLSSIASPADERFRPNSAVRLPLTAPPARRSHFRRAIVPTAASRRCLCHGCDSRADREAVTAGDPRIVGSVQPTAADRRPRARGVAPPRGANGRSVAATFGAPVHRRPSASARSYVSGIEARAFRRRRRRRRRPPPSSRTDRSQWTARAILRHVVV